MARGPKPFTSKICPVCGIDKPRADYYKKGTNVSHKCKPCTLSDCKARAPKYIGKYSEYRNAWRRHKGATDPVYVAKRQALKKARYDILKDELNAKRREIWATIPDCAARKHYRRKDVKDRTPLWVNPNDFLPIYAACPKGFHVDHIIPLSKGGWHMMFNAQITHPPCNLRKGDRVDESSRQVRGVRAIMELYALIPQEA